MQSGNLKDFQTIKPPMGFPQIPDLIYNNPLPEFPNFTKFIIDTDAGGDDAHAILLGLHILETLRKDAELIGITCVNGNTSIENVVKNVNIVVNLHEGKIKPKIYKGCHNDVIRSGYVDSFYKDDGLGGVQEKYLKEFGLYEKQLHELHEEQHAVDFMLEAAEKYGDQLCIICLGPLTNIFLATQMNPKFSQSIGGLAVMGGTYLSIGNTTNACGEFNFQIDVEAASVVMKSPYKFFSILPFDLALGLVFEEEKIHHVIKDKMKTKKSKFIKDIFDEVFVGEIMFTLCDQLCVVLALLPQLITHGFERSVIVANDGFARGQMIIDWYGKIQNLQKRKIITGVNPEEVLKICANANL